MSLILLAIYGNTFIILSYISHPALVQFWYTLIALVVYIIVVREIYLEIRTKNRLR